MLEALEACGTIRGAARACGVGERTVYRWRQRDGRFRAASERRIERHRQQLAERLEEHCADVALNGARHEALDRDGQVVELRRHDQRALDRALDRWAGWGQAAGLTTTSKAYHLELNGAELESGLAAVFAAGLEAGKPREVVELREGEQLAEAVEHQALEVVEPVELEGRQEQLGTDSAKTVCRPGRAAAPRADRTGRRLGGAEQSDRGEGGVRPRARAGGGYKYIPHTPHTPPGLTRQKPS